MYTVYVLRSLRDGSLYIGVTKRAAEERLEEHNAAKTHGNRNRLPYQLIYTEIYESLALGRQREHFLKSGKGRRVLSTLVAVRPLAGNAGR